MTFNTPVELSGQVLPAGTYVFKTVANDRDLVLVTNGDENRVYALLFATPIETPTAPDKVRVELSERPGNSPEAIHAVFYPGDNVGWEFRNSK